jgi:coenzyme F420-0:L-glutamate ligase/coenzyme F420-1:gamma-L-glutamate ligase
MRNALEIRPVAGIGEIVPGADLAAMIAESAPWLRDGDVLVVTSKIVSKAEGQLVEVPPGGPERETARAQVLTSETARPVARRGHTHIVQTHHGFVMASAGIDASNVERSRLVLLPKDPDASARALRTALRERFGVDVAVIVSDTMGRPWRYGLTDVALGAAGLDPILDHRGETDPYGNEMHITQMAVADELSAAAELVKGKFDQVPVAVVRGYCIRPTPADGPGATVLVRDAAHDLFSMGTAEARAAGLAEAARLTDATAFSTGPTGAGAAGTGPPGAGAVGTAIRNALADLTYAPGTTITVVDAGPRTARSSTDGPRTAYSSTAGSSTDGPRTAGSGEAGENIAEGEPRVVVRVAGPAVARDDDLVALGTDVHRVRCALAAIGLATVSDSPDRQSGDGYVVALAVTGE